MIQDAFGTLRNEAGEIVAEGNCQVDVDRGSATMRPIIDTPLLSRQQGVLYLRLDDGAEYAVSDRIIRFRLNVTGVPPGPAYRLTFADKGRLRSVGGGR
jgi:hypothetical protein